MSACDPYLTLALHGTCQGGVADRFADLCRASRAIEKFKRQNMASERHANGPKRAGLRRSRPPGGKKLHGLGRRLQFCETETVGSGPGMSWECLVNDPFFSHLTQSETTFSRDVCRCNLALWKRPVAKMGFAWTLDIYGFLTIRPRLLTTA